MTTAADIRKAIPYDGKVWEGNALPASCEWLCDRYAVLRKDALRSKRFSKKKHARPFPEVTPKTCDDRCAEWCRANGLRLSLVCADDGTGWLTRGVRRYARVNPRLLRFVAQHVEFDTIRYGGDPNKPVSLWQGGRAVAVVMPMWMDVARAITGAATEREG